MIRFNVTGPTASIRALFKTWLTMVHVTDTFDDNDLNVEVSAPLVDEFLEAAEDLGVKTEML